MKKYSFSKKDILRFIIITFGLTIAIGIGMSFVDSEMPLTSLAVVLMYTPALGAMLALLLNKQKREGLPRKFYLTYIMFIGVGGLIVLVMLCIFNQDPSIYLQVVSCAGSIALIAMYFLDDKGKLDNVGLLFKRNGKKSLILIGVFVVLYMGVMFLKAILTGTMDETIASLKQIEHLLTVVLLPVGFPFAIMAFLGEEYGWRYFLQPALQERIGKRLGIIVLGVIWGLWHLPVNLFFYCPTTSLQSIVNQLGICIAYGIFFGYVYMKTKNIWTVTFIHFLNNNLGTSLLGTSVSGYVLTWKFVLINIISVFVFYGPFILAKEYRNATQDTKEPNF